MLDPKKIILTQIFEGGGGGGDVEVEPLSITANGIYTAETGKAYSPVTANVPNSYAVGDEGKVVSNGALVSQTSGSATQNGTVDTTLINSLLVNVSGGGGASNIVTGTFTGTTEGTAIDVTLNYSGSGWPVMGVIYPTNGFTTGQTIYDTIKKYAILQFAFTKKVPTTEAQYGSRPADMAYVSTMYKSSDSTASSLGKWSGTSTVYTYAKVAAISSESTSMVFNSKTNMSVYIGSSSYGFMANVDYTYVILYSS